MPDEEETLSAGGDEKEEVITGEDTDLNAEGTPTGDLGGIEPAGDEEDEDDEDLEDEEEDEEV